MDDRLSSMFRELKGKRAALIAYATGYFPDRKKSAGVIRTMFDSGADAVEIGIPFSDPVMDGPIIQETSRLGLEAGSTTEGVLTLAAEVRRATEKPILLMSYYNPIFHYGLGRFAGSAVESGVDGVIIPDLPAEEMFPLRSECDAVGLKTVAFCSVTTSDSRIELASSLSSGFLYCVSLLGTTGPRERISDELPRFLSRVREHASCPIAAGVGISTPDQCREVGRMADGVIVGSALMRAVIEGDGSLQALSRLTRELVKSLSLPP